MRYRIRNIRLIRTVLMVGMEKTVNANIAPDEARRILERTCDRVKLRANSNGECFGGEIMDSLREAGVELGAHHIKILQTRSVLVRRMELLGEEYPAEILQDYSNRIPLSTALRFLKAAIEDQGRHVGPLSMACSNCVDTLAVVSVKRC